MTNTLELLSAIRELRSALESPVPCPSDPKRINIPLCGDDFERINAVLYAALQHPESLPPRAVTYLLELKSELWNLCCPLLISDPNKVLRRNLNWAREVEVALLCDGSDLAQDSE